MQSILFLRQAALHLPSPAMDTILKGAYKAFASNAKFVNAGVAPLSHAPPPLPAWPMPLPPIRPCVLQSHLMPLLPMSAGSVPHISFMASCIAELWSLDPRASYVHAFTFIRQLAVTMRNALNTKTRDAFLEVALPPPPLRMTCF